MSYYVEQSLGTACGKPNSQIRCRPSTVHLPWVYSIPRAGAECVHILLLRSLCWRDSAIRFSVRIYMRLTELPSADSLCKEYVQLFIRPVLRFRESKVRPCRCQSRRSGPEEACFALPVPCFRVELILDEEPGDDVDHLVRISGQHDRLRSQSNGTCFRDDAISNRANCEGVGEDPYQRQGRLTPFTAA